MTANGFVCQFPSEAQLPDSAMNWRTAMKADAGRVGRQTWRGLRGRPGAGRIHLSAADARNQSVLGPFATMATIKRRKPKSDRKESGVLVRLTDEQKTTLTQAADAAGLGLSAWMRSLALREASTSAAASGVAGGRGPK